MCDFPVAYAIHAVKMHMDRSKSQPTKNHFFLFFVCLTFPKYTHLQIPSASFFNTASERFHMAMAYGKVGGPKSQVKTQHVKHGPPPLPGPSMESTPHQKRWFALSSLETALKNWRIPESPRVSKPGNL